MCIIVCLTRFHSKQVTQNLSRQSPASSRHTICGNNLLRLKPNLRTTRIAQHILENNDAHATLWAYSMMNALSCIEAATQNLCRQNRAAPVRRILTDSLPPYTAICVHNLRPKQVAQNFSRPICVSPMKRLLPNNLPAQFLCLHPPHQGKWPRISED